MYSASIVYYEKPYVFYSHSSLFYIVETISDRATK